MCAQSAESRNTKKGDSNPKSNWFFTWNGYTNDSIVQLCNYFERYTFQEEIGENGNKHLQGVVIKRTRFSTLKKEFPEVHWEVCKNIFAAKEYCKKVESRNGKIYTKGMDVNNNKRLKDYMEGKELYVWQKWILDLYEEEPHQRNVYWLWDKDGGIGKSAMARHMCMNYDCIMVGGKSKDIFFALSEITRKKDIRMIIIDIPRCGFGNVSYQAIEKIKDGMFFNSKYESGMCIFNIPHVIVFANHEPKCEMLSKDRWKIWNLSPTT